MTTGEAWELHQEHLQQAKAARDAAGKAVMAFTHLEVVDRDALQAAVDLLNLRAAEYRGLLTTILPADEMEST